MAHRRLWRWSEPCWHFSVASSGKSLVGRSRLCERIRGLAPNLLAVDYYDRGNVFGVANVLNGLAADAEPAVRTLP